VFQGKLKSLPDWMSFPKKTSCIVGSGLSVLVTTRSRSLTSLTLAMGLPGGLGPGKRDPEWLVLRASLGVDADVVGLAVARGQGLIHGLVKVIHAGRGRRGRLREEALLQ